ncbi:MAG: peroxiredoxin family protein, partial [Candidatus Saccharimonas sp.]|nr:peroxiredoxin family protein [Planctomycetaceae bacterium]
MNSSFRVVVTVLGIVVASGCSSERGDKPLRPGTQPQPPNPNAGKLDYDDVDDSMIKFKDDVAANASLETDLTQLTFTNRDGQQVALKDYLGKQHVILVITRGYAGSICPYCATQTSRLIANYKKLQAQNAEVLVVYPLEKPADTPKLDDFVARAVKSLPTAEHKVPFPLLLDVELKAVDELGIRRDLSKPATYIFDKEGQLRFAYVGTSLADRPSIKALLDQL